jgi:transcription-repair coupling factor (superfamily II helicase)
MNAPDIKAVSVLCGQKRFFCKLLFSAGDKPYLALVLDEQSNPLKEAEKIVSELAAAKTAEENKA